MSDKTIGSIYETTDYAQFLGQEKNRKIVDRNKESFAQAFTKFGNLMPILVRKEKNKLRVIEGHHRFLTLKAMGKPIQYILTQSQLQDEDILLALNNTGKHWNGRDFIEYRMKRGEAAAKLFLTEGERIKKVTGRKLTLGSIMSFMLGHCSTTWAKDLQYQIPTETYNRYFHLVPQYEDLLRIHPTFAGTRMSASLFHVFRDPNYNHSFFMNICNSGLAKEAFKFTPQTMNQTLALVITFYNERAKKTHGKIKPLREVEA
jgi:hypothetical protein